MEKSQLSSAFLPLGHEKQALCNIREEESFKLFFLIGFCTSFQESKEKPGLLAPIPNVVFS